MTPGGAAVKHGHLATATAARSVLEGGTDRRQPPLATLAWLMVADARKNK
jgi:hypothetical protein